MAKLRSKGRFYISDNDAGASPQAYTQVGNLTGIVGFDAAKGEIDITDLLSTGKEFTGDLTDYGSIVISGWYNVADTGQTAVRTDMATAGQSRDFRVELVDDNASPTTVQTWDFTGEVFEFAQDISQGNAMQFTARIRASGLPTYT